MVGIGYSIAPVIAGVGVTYENGLQPDINYTTTSRIEDLPYNKQKPITTGLRAIYDYSALNLKSPISSNGTEVPQRLFLLIQSGPPNQVGVGRITITTNWEGSPSINTQDWVTSSIAFQESVSQQDCKFLVFLIF
jgi:hypothetical protein